LQHLMRNPERSAAKTLPLENTRGSCNTHHFSCSVAFVLFIAASQNLLFLLA
jgi:hypothetical protein